MNLNKNEIWSIVTRVIENANKVNDTDEEKYRESKKVEEAALLAIEHYQKMPPLILKVYKDKEWFKDFEAIVIDIVDGTFKKRQIRNRNELIADVILFAVDYTSVNEIIAAIKPFEDQITAPEN